VLPILLAVVVGALLLLGIVFGIVYLVAGGSDKSLSVIQGECVKREGESAVKAECSESGSYQVASIVPDKAQCADPGQPHVINKAADGKEQVLCLKANP
jgi:collagen type III alpha